MDGEVAYFNWINNSLVNPLVKYLTERIKETFGEDKQFIRNDEADKLAAECSKKIMCGGCGYPYADIKEFKFQDPIAIEFNKSCFCHYDDGAMDKAIKKMAYGFLDSPNYYQFFKYFPFIGAGISVEKIETDIVRLCTTLQLRKEPLKVTF